MWLSQSHFHILVIVLLLVHSTSSIELDLIDCGIDHDLEVQTGNIEIMQYPWLGILYYRQIGSQGETRAVTPVVLIQKEFVLGNAADIGPMPKHAFRKSTRVLLGQRWNDGTGRRVRNYVLHPEYGETFNTIALVQLTNPVRNLNINPLCPPPQRLKDPVFYVVQFDEDYSVLRKRVLNVIDVPSELCKDFYTKADLNSKKMLPPRVTCTVSLDEDQPCVWNAGSALVSRDIWGRWMLLGLGVRGPGCGAPARFLDMSSYASWVEQSLARFQRITISKISKQKYVLRSNEPESRGDKGEYSATGAGTTHHRYGACDEEEKTNRLYRDYIHLVTDNTQYQFLTYNMTIESRVEYSCLELELKNASAAAEMRIVHICPRNLTGDPPKPCHYYKGSYFYVSVFIIYSYGCIFEMNAWGIEKDLVPLDIHEWKLYEGAGYEDFSMARHDYRGQKYMTDFGFEPLDQKMWVPEYDIWTSTNNLTNMLDTTEAPPPRYSGEEPCTEAFVLIETTTPPSTAPTTPRTKRTFKRKTTTVNTTTTPTTIKPGWWGR